jgi:hypothetical protein
MSLTRPVPPDQPPPNTTHPPDIVDDLLIFVGANGMAVDAVQNAQAQEPTTVDGFDTTLGDSILPLVDLVDPGPGNSFALFLLAVLASEGVLTQAIDAVTGATTRSADPDPPGGGPAPFGALEEPIDLLGTAPGADWLLI